MVVSAHTSPDPPEAAGRSVASPDVVVPDGGGSSRSVSIYDVAAAAEVSYQTISRVINGHPNVKPATREHVLATIARLGYRPNRAARALAGGQIQAVTVLTSNTTLYGQRSVIEGIEEAARAADFAMGVRVIESEDTEVVRHSVDRAAERGTALIVVAFDRAGRQALAAVPPGVPLVGIVEVPADDSDTDRPWVWIDDRKAAAQATAYLLGLGHRTVHYVAIPSPTDARQRIAGWRSALADAGIAVPEPVQAGWDPRSGYQAGRLLAADPEVTAVLCGNDELAIGLMRALGEAGRAVPDDVSVVGFDDQPYAAMWTPSLTTVVQDFDDLGRRAFGQLESLIRTGTAPRIWRATPHLVIRESSGPPPAAAERRSADGLTAAVSPGR